MLIVDCLTSAEIKVMSRRCSHACNIGQTLGYVTYVGGMLEGGRDHLQVIKKKKKKVKKNLY